MQVYSYQLYSIKVPLRIECGWGHSLQTGPEKKQGVVPRSTWLCLVRGLRGPIDRMETGRLSPATERDRLLATASRPSLVFLGISPLCYWVNWTCAGFSCNVIAGYRAPGGALGCKNETAV